LILSEKKTKNEIEIRIIARTRVAKTDYCVGATKADGRELLPPPLLTTSLSSGLYRSGKKKLPTALCDTHLQDEPLRRTARQRVSNRSGLERG
jgi:hypothetical protein